MHHTVITMNYFQEHQLKFYKPVFRTLVSDDQNNMFKEKTLYNLKVIDSPFRITYSTVNIAI